MPARERDGEPEEPAADGGAGADAGEKPQPEPSDDPADRELRRKIRVQLADGKGRNIQSMMVTTFWHPDGTPMSAQQFMELLFGKLPEFFKNEAELRAVWSAPDTRSKLLDELAEKGFRKEQLAEMQRLIDAEKSDVFDVLAFVAFASPPITREERATHARLRVHAILEDKQCAFVDFVLDHYVKQGVEELDLSKLTPLIRLKYNNAVADATAELGDPGRIREIFIDFQKYLYEGRPAA